MASGRVRLAVKCLAAVLATACCAFPRFTSFANQEPDDSEASRIDPPRTPRTSWAARSPTVTNASHPQVMLSTASARSTWLPSAFATCSLRRERTYMIGMASTLIMRPGRENSAPCRIRSFHPTRSRRHRRRARTAGRRRCEQLFSAHSRRKRVHAAAQRSITRPRRKLKPVLSAGHAEGREGEAARGKCRSQSLQRPRPSSRQESRTQAETLARSSGRGRLPPNMHCQRS